MKSRASARFVKISSVFTKCHKWMSTVHVRRTDRLGWNSTWKLCI